MNDPISDGMNAAANLLNTDQARNLLNPATKDIGLLLEDLVGAFRFCVGDNWARFYPKWARQRQNRPLTLDEIRKVVPLLQAASLCSDDELQERWAALLESSVSTPENVLPSFGQTLSQLNSEEARFLDRLWAFASRPLAYVSAYAFGREPFSYDKLVEVYDPHLRCINHVEKTVFNDKLTAAQLEDYNRYIHAELVVQDLERLGVITHEQKAEPTNQAIRWLGADVKLSTEYSFTQYGVSFIEVITPKQRKG